MSAMWTDMPLQAAYCRSRANERYLQDLVADGGYDVVHVEHLRASTLGQAIRGIPKIYDSVDCISLLFERAAASSPQAHTRWMARLELPRTRRYEGLLGQGYDRILITSAEDRTALQNLNLRYGLRLCDEIIRVLPNGIDMDYFAPMDLPRQEETLIFSGKMSYHANVATALYLGNEIMPLIWRERPNVRLWIVGKEPPAAVRDLARDERVTVTGYVSDLRPYLAQAMVALSPMAYGVGIQNKILEAMALATPVVTSASACGSLAAIPGTDLLTGQSARELAQAALQLLQDPARARQIGESGRRYIEMNHNSTVVAGDLVHIYQEAIDSFSGSAIYPAD
jgi:glycosyltransferase involved in cell wall biosynthesis